MWTLYPHFTARSKNLMGENCGDFDGSFGHYNYVPK